MFVLEEGLSHRSAPVSVLERAALDPAAREALLRELTGGGCCPLDDPVLESVVLSTCNRIELYADVEKFHAGVDELTRALSRHSGIAVAELTPYLYVHYEDRAVHHLYSVACGLDSMVIGEGQILGQLKDALAVAQDENTTCPRNTRRLHAERLGQFLGFAHLRGIKAERRRYFCAGSVDFQTDTGDESADGGHFAMPLHDGRHGRMRHQSSPRTVEGSSSAGSNWSVRSSSPGV
jgi:hypothetical protein